MTIQADAMPPPSRSIFRHLYFQVLCAVVIGVLLGHFYPEIGVKMEPLGKLFIKLIKMMIAPIIFCTVVHGIASMEDMRKVGRVGIKALLYFEGMTTLALIVGLVVVNLLQPGAGMNVNPETYAKNQKVMEYTEKAKKETVLDHVMDIVPETVIGAFAKGEIIQVLLFSILFGFALFSLGKRGHGMLDFIDQSAHVLFKIIGFIMRVAPIGAFGAMAYTIGAHGISSLWALGQLMLGFYMTCLIFIFLVLGAVAKISGFSIFKFIRYIREELLIVLGTSSSESVLPRMMAKMQVLGCEKSVVGLVIPTGYSFNLDGTCIYLTMAAIFLAQATNTNLSLMQELAILAVLLLTSKGAAGVTGSGFIVLAATLSSVETIPVASIGLILGVDRFMSEGRALTNLVGNGVATVVVAKWENALDVKTMHRHLNQEPDEVTDISLEKALVEYEKVEISDLPSHNKTPTQV